MLGLCSLLPVQAQQTEPEAAPAAEEESGMTAEQFLATLSPKSGDIALPGGKAQLKLSDAFQYLDPEDSARLLVDAWGNPPRAAESVLGMILPADTSPLSEGGWGVVITYSDDGHVADEDADKIDYADVLKGMQDDTKESNKLREQNGFGSVDLVGWAEDPHYDKLSHKIYWAKDLQFGDAEEHTLNYAVRVLGREGVLELNAVANLNQLSAIKPDMRQIVAFTEFTEGNRYQDYNASTDKTAAYGLAALVAGGVAAKAGLFAKLGVMLLAFKKFIIIGVIGVIALFGKLLGRKKAS